MNDKQDNKIIMWFKNQSKKKLVIIGSAAAITVIAAALIVVFCVNSMEREVPASIKEPGYVNNGDKSSGDNTDKDNTKKDNDSQSGAVEDNTAETTGEGENETTGQDISADDNDIKENQADENLGSGAPVDVSKMEKTPKSIGIDIARYQGKTDWKAVAADGIDFAMIRAGYRSIVSGEINEDPYAAYNITNALANNINVGIYFFSSAVTEDEAVEEANWVADFIKNYKITYPVAYNCEGFSDSDSRQYALTKEERSKLAVKFLETIEGKGYTPMFYASRYEMEDNKMWDMTSIENKFKVWVAWYPENPYPITENAGYRGEHHMWQYTSSGRVSGINGAVDINVSYMDIVSDDKNGNNGGGENHTIENVTVSPEANMNFKTVNDTVTAKIEVNLRDKPSQDSDSTVLFTLKNGETAARTAVSDSGWSRLEYNGRVCYAVSSYLTTDLSVKNEEGSSEEETTMRNQFTQTDDIVTAKEEVNLRTLPSATDSEVVYTLKNGERIQRTGTSDLGWSRVIYKGQTLYCITSYLQVDE